MFRSSLLALGACAAVAACNDSQPTKPRQPIVVRSEAQDQLHQLDDMNRDIGLKRAILESGMRCKRVTRSGYVQEHKMLSMWMANCDEKIDYAVFVGPDGSAQVRYCSQVAQLGLPACVMKTRPAKPG